MEKMMMKTGLKTGLKRLTGRARNDKAKPTQPAEASSSLDIMGDDAHHGISTTSSDAQIVDTETQKSHDPLEKTGQEFHEESTEPAPDQQNEVAEPMVEVPAEMPQNDPLPEPSVHLKDQELFPNPSPSVVDSLSTSVVDSLSTSETLWDEAYEATQRRQRRMVIWYEKILSSNLKKTVPDQPPWSPSSEPFENKINQEDSRVRRSQMRELLERWLNEPDEEESLQPDDTKSSVSVHTVASTVNDSVFREFIPKTDEERSEASTWSRDDVEVSNLDSDDVEVSNLDSDDVQISQLVPRLKDIIRKTVEITQPEAILALVSACYASKVLLQPTPANENECSGVIYVISRMEWYSRLPKVLAEDRNGNKRERKLRERIVDLYGAILSYLMKMVCANFGSLAPSDIFYSRSRSVSLTTVTDAENELPLFNEYLVKLPLEILLETARTERTTSTHDTEQVPSAENSELLGKLHIADPKLKILRPEEEQSQAAHKLHQLLLSTEQYKRFQEWDKSVDQLLCISGSAGQGKTMLLTAIVQTLSGKTSGKSDSWCLASFFFDHSRPESNNAAAALKNLIWLLIVKQPSLSRHQPPLSRHQPPLSRHLADKFSSTGRENFDSPNDFLALSAVFYDMIQDDELSQTYFVVDALDECSSDRERPGLNDLLHLITKSMEMSKKIRWVVSTDYSDTVELAFKVNGCLHLALGPDLQGSHVYIRSKVSELAIVKSYDEELETSITEALCERSLRNYLWVNIVCKALESEEIWYATTIVDEVKDLDDLELLYEYMKRNIVGLPRRDKEFCMDILSTMAIVDESLHIDELKALVRLAPRVDLKTILRKVSTFLQVRNDVVSLLHPFTKVYVRNHVLNPSTTSQAHSKLTQRCLDYLGNTLKRKSGTTQEPLLDGTASESPLLKGNYASLHWMTHLSEISNVTEDDEIRRKVQWFLEEHFLDWVEDLISEGQLPLVAVKLQKLDLCLPSRHNAKQDNPNTLQALIRDAHLFLRLHQSTNAPKDVHVYNTLLFCPQESIIRKAWLPKVLPWVARPPTMDERWGCNFNAFLANDDWIRAIAFSPDGRLIASGSDNSRVRIWDAEMGTTQHTLQIESGWVYCVAFSSRGTVAAGSDDNSITLWESATGRKLTRLPDHPGTVNAICFSEDGSKLAAASDRDVLVWDLDKYEPRSLEARSEDYVRCVAFLQDGRLLATSGDDSKIRLWDVEARELRSTCEGHTDVVNSLVFSPTMKLVASGSDDGTVGIWDVERESDQRLQTLKSTGGRSVNSVSFSPDGLHLASATDNTIDIWDTKTGDRLQVLQARSISVRSVAFSPSGAYLACGSRDMAVHLWYAPGKRGDGDPSKGLVDGATVDELAISPDGSTVAATHSGGTVSLWNIETNELLNPEMGFEHSRSVYSLTFSPLNGEMLLSSSSDCSVRVCNVASGKRLHLFEGHNDWVRCATWSADGAYVASASDDSSIRIWKIGSEEDETPTVLEEAHGGSFANTVAFSPNGTFIASGGGDQKVVVWERKQDGKWERKYTLEGHTDDVVGVVISPNSKRIVSSSSDKMLRIWDIENGVQIQEPIEIEWAYNRMWFDKQPEEYVMTAWGPQLLNSSSSSSRSPPWCPYRIHFDEDKDQWWIMWEDKKVVFLPEMFRPGGGEASRILDNKVVLGTNLGQVNVYRFSDVVKPSL